MERVHLEDFNAYQSIDAVTDKHTFNSLLTQGQALAKNISDSWLAENTAEGSRFSFQQIL